MTRPAILLVGAGGHARSCIDVVEREDRYAIAGLIGMPGEIGHDVLGYAVLGSDADLPRLRGTVSDALVAVGQIRTPEPRMRLYSRLAELGFQLPAIVSPHACVSRHASLGEGSIVMAGAIVNAGARVGCNCIINSRALIEHDVQVGDHCHVATAAVLNGGVILGMGSFVGSGSLVREGVVLGAACLVGMGLVIRHSYPDQSRITKVD